MNNSSSILRHDIRLSPSIIYAIIWLFAAASFWILDIQAVFTGDDLGYAFTDSSLHNCDGKRVQSLSDIIATQSSHFLRVNGRFIIHCIVMLFMGILGKTWFCIANAAMFGLLVVFACKLILPTRKPAFGAGVAVAFLLWLCLPRPGVIMLSLMAYAINYLWTATVILGILILFRAIIDRKLSRTQFYIAAILAVIAGSLQESFTIPVSAGMLMWWLSVGKKASVQSRVFIICFICGTAVLFMAPGNYARTAQGGGFTPEGLLAKSSALASDLFFSSINLLAIAVIVIALAFRNRADFFRRNILLLTAILVSLLFASATYTAERQLFAPSLFSAIILGRLIFTPAVAAATSSILATAGLSVAYIGMIAGAYIIRQPVADAYESVLAQAKDGKKTIIIPDSECREGKFFHFLFDRFNDDPAQNRELKYLFDSYTKNGLSRLYSPAHVPSQITTFLPAPHDSIVAAAHKAVHFGDSISPAPLSPYFSSFAIPAPGNGRKKRRIKRADGQKISYERFVKGDSLYYVVPAETGKIFLK